MKEGGISIWFLIGLIISVYGAIITGAGVYQYYYPPTPSLALADRHACMWWGLFMLIVGVFYVVKFRPRG